jgi:hypothetical protein
LIGLATLILVVLGAAVWTTRPVAAQEPPMDPSYGAWCARVHAELFSHLPASVQDTLMRMHEKH